MLRSSLLPPWWFGGAPVQWPGGFGWLRSPAGGDARSGVWVEVPLAGLRLIRLRPGSFSVFVGGRWRRVI